ncbi:lysophospholipase [Mycobacterium sp. CBMA293]|uniref:alpha/beta hydrolase family protein n=1 Tax=unclassified Mycolicibacterium TaxID=2636767 RepID=UPI0012DD614E|nr:MULTISPECIES: alpha/beta fold hydrolase [unclassified Mycolicibacterium]MUL47296.1 lysophospholipase [Mycolicibacterium sp. CBMA 360]MUL61407.1 lysophospholipase [Mycolicibacterium sp. CBMA 335]MUL72142.1 lysophospholipase [Mycolicibacterium sp. CBMA 311]MUL96309.1 lysophospholipase [Mycolicibacterium sp. CBMA 230]MUM08868.1 osmotically inducible protein OsmC [Mycolicibacterium sp. CBMA 213]
MAERVKFPSSTGPMLAGIIDLPEGTPRGWGVFAHGFTLGKDSPAAARICKQLASDGIGMLRFDAIGLGDSEGHWGDGSFTHKTNDVIEACKFMAERGTPSNLLVGHSFGGASVLAGARQAPEVRAVVTVGAPIDPSHVEKQYDDVLECVMANGSAQWMVGGRELTLKRDFVEDVRTAEIDDKIRGLKLPLLILHSPTDNTVGIENASRIFQTARHPRSFVSLEGSEHLLTGPGQAKRAGRIIGAWADAYMGPDKARR